MSSPRRNACLPLLLFMAVVGLPGQAADTATSDADPLVPANFVSLTELGASGWEIPIQSPSPLIDANSHIQITIDPAVLEAGLNLERLRSEWAAYKATARYLDAKRHLEDATPATLALSQESYTDTVELFFTKRPQYSIGITATVHPKGGEPYSITVPGYTTVKMTRTISNDASASGDKETVTTSLETSVGRRVYRAEFPNPLSDVSEGALQLVSDVFPETRINLKDLDLKDGDRVSIVATNHFRNFPMTVTWDLAIRNIGWRTKQDATLLLIKRINEPPGPNVNESNFKPAPGTSFLFDFESRNRTWNFLDMSFGINGSFLDFRDDETLEVGVGPVVSFFNGILQVNYGWNLNANTEREYWSIGIGFLDIAGKIKEAKTKK